MRRWVGRVGAKWLRSQNIRWVQWRRIAIRAWYTLARRHYGDPPLDSLPEDKVTFIDMHSVLNILNVLQLEILQAEERLGESEQLQDLQKQLWDLTDALGDRERGIALLSDHTVFSSRFLAGMDGLVASTDEDIPAMIAARENVAKILSILEIRAVEYLERSHEPARWKEHSINTLAQNYQQVFAAIEQNAKGAYRIVHNVAAKEPGGYLINVNISSVRGAVIQMPPVFQDVFRDLMANARKYTPPGGQIDGGIHESENELRLVVEDAGCGIPEEEIAEVVKYGRRGSNVSNRPTMGGGFGLTKAVYFTHRFGGRIWITSRTDEPTGTKIDIRIPVPTAADA